MPARATLEKTKKCIIVEQLLYVYKKENMVHCVKSISSSRVLTE